MSLGPLETKEQSINNRFERMQVTAKKAVTRYFEKPFHYLFYCGIFYLTVSFAVGHRLIPEFYILMIILGGFEAYDQYRQNKK